MELEHLVFGLNYISFWWNDEIFKCKSWFFRYFYLWFFLRYCFSTRWSDVFDPIHFFYLGLVWINGRQKEVTHSWFFSISRRSTTFSISTWSLLRLEFSSCWVIIVRSSGPSSVEYTIMTLHGLVQHILIIIFHFY